jgi:hypothetical protein
MTHAVDRTVEALFRRLEHGGVRYAVLRNYERLPVVRDASAGHATDIDLVVASADVPALRRLLADLADQCGWDALTECDHWRQSTRRPHHIEVFRFYGRAPRRFLQVDVFHAYVAWGLPLFDEAAMLAGRMRSPDGLLTHVDPLKEHVYYLLKIAGLHDSPRTAGKAARYRDKTTAFCSGRGAALRDAIRAVFSRPGVAALEALLRDDMPSFARHMQLAKIAFLARTLVRDPAEAIGSLVARARDNLLRYRLRQCGIVVAVHAPTEAERASVAGAFGGLVDLGVIDQWRPETEARLSRPARSVLEQGGVVVRWTSAEKADLRVDGLGGEDAIADAIFARLVERHAALFNRRGDPDVAGARQPGATRLAAAS